MTDSICSNLAVSLDVSARGISANSRLTVCFTGTKKKKKRKYKIMKFSQLFEKPVLKRNL